MKLSLCDVRWVVSSRQYSVDIMLTKWCTNSVSWKKKRSTERSRDFGESEMFVFMVFVLCSFRSLNKVVLKIVIGCVVRIGKVLMATKKKNEEENPIFEVLHITKLMSQQRSHWPRSLWPIHATGCKLLARLAATTTAIASNTKKFAVRPRHILITYTPNHMMKDHSHLNLVAKHSMAEAHTHH